MAMMQQKEFTKTMGSPCPEGGPSRAPPPRWVARGLVLACPSTLCLLPPALAVVAHQSSLLPHPPKLLPIIGQHTGSTTHTHIQKGCNTSFGGRRGAKNTMRCHYPLLWTSSWEKRETWTIRTDKSISRLVGTTCSKNLRSELLRVEPSIPDSISATNRNAHQSPLSPRIFSSKTTFNPRIFTDKPSQHVFIIIYQFDVIRYCMY